MYKFNKNILVILIIVIIVGLLFWYFLSKRKKEEFNVLRDPKFEEIYNSTCKEIIDEGITIAGNYITIPTGKDEAIKRSAKKKCDNVWDKYGGEKERILKVIGDELKEIYIDEIKSVYAGPLPEEIMDWATKEIPTKAYNYLVFSHQKYDPIVGGYAVRDEPAHEFTHPDEYLNRITPIGHQDNVLVEAINKDYDRLFVNKVPAPMNTDKLIFGIKRYGHPPSYRVTKKQDLRGYSKGQFDMLLKAGTTRDPHGTRRAGHTNVMSQLVGGKGLSNFDIADDYVKQHAKNIDDKEYRTFEHVKDRFIDRRKLRYANLGLVTNNNILQDVVLGD
jgi:hypothetical protein